MRNLEKRKSDKAEEVQTEADFVKEQAMQQYEKYRRVEPSERGTAMFDEMLRLKRENMMAIPIGILGLLKTFTHKKI